METKKDLDPTSDMYGVTTTYTWNLTTMRATGVTDQTPAVMYIWQFSVVNGSYVIGNLISITSQTHEVIAENDPEAGQVTLREYTDNSLAEQLKETIYTYTDINDRDTWVLLEQTDFVTGMRLVVTDTYASGAIKKTEE